MRKTMSEGLLPPETITCYKNAKKKWLVWYLKEMGK